MYDTELEYSYSGGQYWSKYPHCRVFENGSYEVMVRDNFGQTSTAYVDINNNRVKEVGIPTFTSDYIEHTWSDKAVVVKINPVASSYVVYRLNGGSWQTNTGVITVNIPAVDGTTTIEAYCQDEYGNKSLPNTFVCNIDTTAPTNINFVPEITYANEIMTTVTAVENVGFPMRYSITYDNGKTWSTPQMGRKFGLINPAKGTYQINCRAYNSAGLFVEGTMIEKIITHTIR